MDVHSSVLHGLITFNNQEILDQASDVLSRLALVKRMNTLHSPIVYQHIGDVSSGDSGYVGACILSTLEVRTETRRTAVGLNRIRSASGSNDL